MRESLTLVGIVGTDGDVYYISFPDAGGRLCIPVDQCRITEYGVVVEPGALVRILTPPKMQAAIDVFPYDPTASTHETPHICIGARPDLNIPGILVDRNTGEIAGTYTLNSSRPERTKDEWPPRTF